MTTGEFWAVIYPWIVAGLGGLMGAALLLPTKLGEALFQFRTHKLLEEFKAQQNRELERFKADQSQGLEHLREQLNHLGDRGRRSNEMEFVAIESVWKAFVKAWLSTNTCIGAMMIIPRFSTMSDQEFASFFSSSDLTPREREMLTNASDREKEYSIILNWRTVAEAGTDVYQARLTLREKRIFMPTNLTSEFSDLIERMSAAQVERRLSLQNPHIPAYNYGKATTDWMQDCVSVFDRMAALANQRLFRAEHMERDREAS
jgi:hypothetical protein